MNGYPPSDALVIGYGNEWRGDDGAGPAVACRIASMELPGVAVLSLHQLTPELAETISRAGRVVFVDATTERDVGLLIRSVRPEPADELMTHVVSPEALLALAQLLYSRAPPAWLLAIEGWDFRPGEKLSEQTTALVAEATDRIVTLLATEHPIEMAP